MNHATLAARIAFLMPLLGALVAFDAAAARFRVTRFDDPAPDTCLNHGCSLREAVIAANESPGQDTIILLPGTHYLTRNGAGEDDSLTGDLDIRGDVTILGADSDVDVVQMTQFNDRVFHIVTGASLTMEHVTIQGGAVLPYQTGNCEATCAGGGIFVGDPAATLNLHDVSVLTNTATIGGGVYARFDAPRGEIFGARIEGNYATRSGGLYWEGGGRLYSVNVEYNSALESDGGATIIVGDPPTSSWTNLFLSFRFNEAANCGGGSLVARDGRILSMYFSAEDNHATNDGGGLCVSSDGAPIVLDGPTFRRNAADRNGGAIKILGDRSDDGVIHPLKLIATNVGFNENTAGGDGGAIHDDLTNCGPIVGACASELVLLGGSGQLNYANGVSGNGDGAIIFHRGRLLLTGARFASSYAKHDGGFIFQGDDPANPLRRHTYVVQSYLSYGNASKGAAIAVEGAAGLSVVHSTLSSNRAGRQGGAIAAHGSGMVYIENSTLSGNFAPQGGGIHVRGGTVDLRQVTLQSSPSMVYFGTAVSIEGTSASVTIVGSIIRGSCEGSTAIVAPLGNIESDGNTCNLAPGQPVNVTYEQLLLHWLQYDYGHWVARPEPGSIALDQVPASACSSLDQRAFVRASAPCDSGAYEVGAIDDTIYRNGFPY